MQSEAKKHIIYSTISIILIFILCIFFNGHFQTTASKETQIDTEQIKQEKPFELIFCENQTKTGEDYTFTIEKIRQIKEIEGYKAKDGYTFMEVAVAYENTRDYKKILSDGSFITTVNGYEIEEDKNALNASQNQNLYGTIQAHNKKRGTHYYPVPEKFGKMEIIFDFGGYGCSIELDSSRFIDSSKLIDPKEDWYQSIEQSKLKQKELSSEDWKLFYTVGLCLIYLLLLPLFKAIVFFLFSDRIPINPQNTKESIISGIANAIPFVLFIFIILICISLDISLFDGTPAPNTTVVYDLTRDGDRIPEIISNTFPYMIILTMNTIMLFFGSLIQYKTNNKNKQ